MQSLSPLKEQLFHIARKGGDMGLLYHSLDAGDFHGRTLSIGGREYLHFANCSYLGLETDPRVKAGAIDAVQRYGIITSNSRAYASSPLYQELERCLNQMLPGHLVITTTTTLGHCSVLPLLVKKGDVIISDFHAHNSLQMAAKQCVADGAQMVYLRRHNDMARLEELANRPEYSGKRLWFLGDGIYSMQGEWLDLAGLKGVLDRTPNLYAYIDDAHGFGWTGRHGAGYVMGDPEGVHPRMITAVSMCKAFGAAGGIISFASEQLQSRVDHIGQTQVFSAPIPNPVLGAAIASARICLSPDIDEYQADLTAKIRYFKQRCRERSIPLNTRAVTPVQFIEIGAAEQTYEVAMHLKEAGIVCSLAVYPAMPRKHGGLRVSFTRHLQYVDIDYLIDQLSLALGSRMRDARAEGWGGTSVH